MENPSPAWYDDASLPVLALDFETSNLDHGDPRTRANEIVMCCVAKNGMPAGEVAAQTYQWPGRCILVAHNAKFELGWLKRLGVDTTDWLVWDTMIGEYVIAGNRKFDLSLDATCRRHGLPGKHSVVARMMDAGICPSEIPRHLLLARCNRDVDSVVAIARKQRKYMRANGLLPVMFTRCIVTPVLTEIEFQGMCLDKERVLEEHAKQTKIRAEAETALAALSNGANLRSGKQLGELVYGSLGFQEPCDKRGNILKTASGKPRTDEATLSGFKAKSPAQKAFLTAFRAHRGADSALTKSLDFFKGVVEERGGVFFGTFNQCVTKTHRLSSSGRRILVGGKQRGVQFQNLPRDYKRLFCAGAEGYVLVEADGAGLEFRVAGELGGDPVVLHSVESGEDVHRFTASVINGIPEEGVTSKQRTAAKAHTFKPLFSEGKTGTPREQRYYRAFKEKYATMTAEQERWVATAMKTGKLVLPSGLITYHKLRVTASGYVEGANVVRNIPIQSFATADIIPVSLVYTFWGMREAGIDGAIVNMIHDSVVAYISSVDVDKYRQIVVDSFLDKTYRYLDLVYGRKMVVPLGVGFKAGKFWGEGEELKFSHKYDGGNV